VGKIFAPQVITDLHPQEQILLPGAKHRAFHWTKYPVATELSLYETYTPQNNNLQNLYDFEGLIYLGSPSAVKGLTIQLGKQAQAFCAKQHALIRGETTARACDKLFAQITYWDNFKTLNRS